MSTKHTATPWEIYARNIIRTPDGTWVAETQMDLAANTVHKINLAERDANAAFIVRCVNSYEALVEALKSCHKAMHVGGKDIAAWNTANQLAQAALKAAEEAPHA